MNKWEDKLNAKLEKLKKGDLEGIVNEKLGENADKRARYREMEKLLKAKNNLGEIENVLEYREKLKNDLKDLKQEIETRKDAVLANEESKKLEEELAEITEEIIKTEKELKDPEIKENRKNELLAKREELYGKRDENNSKYAKNQKILEGELNREGKLKDLSKKELEDNIVLLKTRMSKCNMVAKNLLNGASWDTINLKLDNWDKKFTKKKDEKQVKKTKIENKNSSKEEEIFTKSSFENKTEEFDDKDIISDSNAEEYNKNKRLMFEKKHPRLAKIQKWFNKILGREEEKMLPEPEEKQELGKSEKIKAASELDKAEKPKEQDKGQDEKDESFKEYIRAVARNGVKGANAERLAAWREKNGYRNGNEGPEGLSDSARSALEKNDKTVEEIRNRIDEGR